MDHLAPFLGFGGDEGAEFFRRAPLRDDAHGVEARGGLRLLEIGNQRRVERVDDRLRRAGAGKEALPALPGMSGSRLAASTAMSFSLPAWINGSAGVRSENSIDTLPLATSVSPGSVPL